MMHPEWSGRPGLGAENAAAGAAGILVVDDRAENLAAFEALLSPLGHPISLARSGAEALERSLQRSFAVVVMDVHMPLMDGFETASLLRRREAYRATPIIFTSAYGMRVADMKDAYVAGSTDFIDTPSDGELLKFKVSAFVELYHRTERMKRNAEAAASAFAALMTEADRTFHAMEIRMPLERLGHALSGLESELSNVDPR